MVFRQTCPENNFRPPVFGGKLPGSVAQRRLGPIDADDLRIPDLQRDAPGDAAGAGAEIEHPGRTVQLQLPQETDGAGHEQFRLGTRDQHAGPDGETVPAELGDPQHILDGFAAAKAPEVVFQLRLPLFRHGGPGLDDVGVGGGAQFLREEHQNQTPRLRRRVQGLEAGDAVADELGEQHYECSMMVLRKAVMSRPAVRTIRGTSDALVMPGIVLISRK